MKLRRTALALVAGLTLSVAPGAATEGELPEACGTRAPVIEDHEQLVERTLYFHGEAALGDADGYRSFFDSTNRQTMDDTAPTAATPKVDSNASKSVYPASLPGNPIMTAWHATTDQPLRVACFGFNFWALGDGADMTVMLWPDSPFILGTGTPTAVSATGDGENLVHYQSRFKPLKPVAVVYEMYAQIEASAPAAILYDSVDYPSSMTLVTIEPKPAQ